MNDKHIINFDYEGFPEKAMTIRDILQNFGAEYNKETNKWEIPESEHLDIIPTSLEDDGMGYGVNEQYFISGNFYKHNYGPEGFRFFRDKEIDYVDIWVAVGVYPGQIVKDNNGKEWVVDQADETDMGQMFDCFEFNMAKIIAKKQKHKLFTIDQIKKFKDNE